MPVMLPLSLAIALDRDVDRTVANSPRDYHQACDPVHITRDHIVESACLPLVGEHGHTSHLPPIRTRDHATGFMPSIIVSSPNGCLRGHCVLAHDLLVLSWDSEAASSGEGRSSRPPLLPYHWTDWARIQRLYLPGSRTCPGHAVRAARHTRRR
jgi:hypothetical protein